MQRHTASGNSLENSLSRRPLTALVRRGLNLRAAANAPNAQSLSATQFPEDALHCIAPEKLGSAAAIAGLIMVHRIFREGEGRSNERLATGN